MAKKRKTQSTPRMVKCYVTGEYGWPDEFIKRDGRWWKDQETYDEYQTNLMYYHKIKDMICDLLDYEPGQIFPTVFAKKLKELDFYGYECIYKTFLIHEKDLMFWTHHKEFDTDYGKIAYIFAIVKNNINDVYRQMKKEKRQQEIQERKVYDAPDEFDADIQSVPHDNKDISKWLGDD